MTFNEHSDLVGKHAFLSPSKSYWLDYDEDKIRQSFKSSYSALIGTTLHSFAAKRIKKHKKLRKADVDSALFYLLDEQNTGGIVIPESIVDIDYIYPTLMDFVNDGIGFHMTPEVVLYYSQNCFGTTDAISCINNVLRIHDLKTGTTPAHMEQLLIYAALFCFETKTKPSSLSEIELRIYQDHEILWDKPSAEEIEECMETIRLGDKIVATMREA
jgi:hypothetical protein